MTTGGVRLHPEELYRAWAPPNSPWSPWVKPVLFATAEDLRPGSPDVEAALVLVRRLRADARDTFVIVNQPGAQSVATGLALAQQGFRPIPLFNGVGGQNTVIRVGPIVAALVAGAEQLSRIAIAADAPPAFLLDADRMLGAATPRMLDNRWLVVPEDFPSGNRLLSAGLRKGVIVGETYGDDLAHVLVRYHRADISLMAIDSTGTFTEHKPRVPSHFGNLFARSLVLMGLRRSSAGGFGAVVPDPSEGSGYG